MKKATIAAIKRTNASSRNSTPATISRTIIDHPRYFGVGPMAHDNAVEECLAVSQSRSRAVPRFNDETQRPRVERSQLRDHETPRREITRREITRPSDPATHPRTPWFTNDVAIAPVIPFNAIPLLAGIRLADRGALEPLCLMRRYEKGETIFHEAEPAERIHFVVAGRVKIVKATGAREIILEILGPGEPVGAVAVFERRAFPATAVVMEDSTILSIPEREFFQLLES